MNDQYQYKQCFASLFSQTAQLSILFLFFLIGYRCKVLFQQNPDQSALRKNKKKCYLRPLSIQEVLKLMRVLSRPEAKEADA